MSSQQLESQFLFFQHMQVNFDFEICGKIFGDDCNHMYNKWLECNSNIIDYISRMDSSNMKKFLLYFEH